MAPKRSGPGERRGRGRSGIETRAGGGRSGVAGGSPDVNLDDLEIIDIDPHRPGDSPHVEVAYVDQHLLRHQPVPEGRIREGWLEMCVADSMGPWGRHLPGVEIGDLKARQIPEGAKAYGELARGKGIVVIETSGDEKGPVSQISDLKAGALNMKVAILELRKEIINENKFQYQALHSEIEGLHIEIKGLHTEIEGLHTKIGGLHTEIEGLHTEMERREGVFKGQLVTFEAEKQELKSFLRKGVELSNKVKKRVALTVARMQVEKAIGRKKEDDMGWSSFFSTFGKKDWEHVGIKNSKVRDLLKDGSYEFNDSIPNISPQEVVGSIASMPMGILRTAWEEIFYLAFNRTISEDIFQEEVVYAQEQKKHLDMES